MLDHYYEQLHLLGQLMAIPKKDEPPFYDEEEHDTMTEEERVEMHQAWRAYRENHRTGMKPDE